jgi:hypothetical protein
VDGSQTRFHGEIANTPKAIDEFIKKINPAGGVLKVCYEVAPCGYGIYHQLTALGHDLSVVASSLISINTGGKVKTDRRNGEGLACLHRVGALTVVRFPDQNKKPCESYRGLAKTCQAVPIRLCQSDLPSCYVFCVLSQEFERPPDERYGAKI